MGGMNYYEAVVPTLVRMLQNLDSCLRKGEAFARERKFEPEVLLQARLAPDQFALVRQVQAACDAAKFAAAKLSGKQPPSNPDTEQTMVELRARIATTTAYLESFAPQDFDGAEERACSHGWMQGKSLIGRDYVQCYALPNFLFHVTTAYAILRHNGVGLSKTDFLGALPFKG